MPASENVSLIWVNLGNLTSFGRIQLTVTCSKSTIKTLDKSVKYVQS